MTEVLQAGEVHLNELEQVDEAIRVTLTSLADRLGNLTSGARCRIVTEMDTAVPDIRQGPVVRVIFSDQPDAERKPRCK